MPKKQIDYTKTIIYKIVCKDLNIKECYIGHTTNFTKRKNNHKSNCDNNKEYNVYNFIRDNGGFENWDMIEIEKYPCKDLNEAKARERYYIEYFNSTLNLTVPLRTPKEYNQDNKDVISDYKKDYYKQNRENILAKTKQHYQENIEKKKEYDKEYRKKNKEEIKEKQQKYKQVMIICECGCEVLKGNLNRHMRSIKHQEFLISKETNRETI